MTREKGCLFWNIPVYYSLFFSDKEIYHVDNNEKILKDLIDLADSKKGMDIVAIDVREVSILADYILIMTSNSAVHSASLGKHIIDYFVDNGLKSMLYSQQPKFNNPWILLDATDIIVHIFSEEARQFYALEKVYFRGTQIYESEKKTAGNSLRS